MLTNSTLQRNSKFERSLFSYSHQESMKYEILIKIFADNGVQTCQVQFSIFFRSENVCDYKVAKLKNLENHESERKKKYRKNVTNLQNARL